MVFLNLNIKCIYKSLCEIISHCNIKIDAYCKTPGAQESVYNFFIIFYNNNSNWDNICFETHGFRIKLALIINMGDDTSHLMQVINEMDGCADFPQLAKI